MQIFGMEISPSTIVLVVVIVLVVSFVSFSKTTTPPISQTLTPIPTPAIPTPTVTASPSAIYSLKSETYQGRNHHFQLTYPPKFSVRNGDFTQGSVVVEQILLGNFNQPTGGVTDFTLQVISPSDSLPNTLLGLAPQKTTVAGQPAVFFSKYFGYNDGSNPDLEMVYVVVIKDHTQYQFTFNGTSEFKNPVIQTILKGLKFTK